MTKKLESVVTWTGVICIAVTIFVNSSGFLNDENLVDRSYSDKPSHQRISNQKYLILEDSHSSGRTLLTGNGIIFPLKQKANDSSLNKEFNLLG